MGGGHHDDWNKRLERRRGKPTLYVCDDCGRRFYNQGWHAEVCGSPNYHREET